MTLFPFRFKHFKLLEQDEMIRGCRDGDLERFRNIAHIHLSRVRQKGDDLESVDV